MTISKNILRILIPALILLVIAGIWLFKSWKPSEDALPEGARPLEITSVDLTELQSHGLPILLDFGADACGPCQAMAPALKKMHAEMQGKVIIHYTDVWQHPEAGENFPVQVVPTQVFFNADGTPYVPSEEVQKAIPNFQMYSTSDNDEHVVTTHTGGLTEEQMRLIFADMGVKA